MTRLSSATAAALKSAGFPQPLPAIGQVWYNVAGTPYYVTAANGNRCDYFVRETLFIDRYLIDENFAPTAEDILAELSKRVYPNVIRLDVSAYDTFGLKNIQTPEYSVRSRPKNLIAGSFHANLTESLAAAYLSLSSHTT